MAEADRVAEAQAVIQAERQAVHDCEAEVAGLKSQLTDAQRKLAEKRASLNLAERVMAIFTSKAEAVSSAKEPPTKRRMRLGAKKRAIYTLVAKQVCTLDQIATHLTVLNDTDIDRRYIRDVVRDAINDGDMQGDIDHQFVMSEAGREILEKAPVPTGWDLYEDAAEMRHAMREVRSVHPKENEPPVGGSEAEEVAPSSERTVEHEDEARNGLF
ncbi:MAG: hypothetical protein AAGA72_16295 [Pseudomonadota bacterium]